MGAREVGFDEGAAGQVGFADDPGSLEVAVLDLHAPQAAVLDHGVAEDDAGEVHLEAREVQPLDLESEQRVRLPTLLHLLVERLDAVSLDVLDGVELLNQLASHWAFSFGSVFVIARLYIIDKFVSIYKSVDKCDFFKGNKKWIDIEH